ncbi:hypothetical protein M5689_012760 [Euphorbia peplus]|nr:hypothetical protein M5689_012760 [Euphorbia peplus]
MVAHGSEGSNEIKVKKQELNALLLQKKIIGSKGVIIFCFRGAKNSKFFHQMASSKHLQNLICRLQRPYGSWAETHDDLTGTISDYFEQLFDAEPRSKEINLEFMHRRVTTEINVKLTRPFTLDEFKEAIFSMDPYKAPSPDGLNPTYFQKFWATIGPDIYFAACQWFRSSVFPSFLFDTNVVLIPKVNTPISMKDLRHISLCNVIHKIIVKVLANKLKGILPNLISAEQSAFVPGRSIIDNVIVAFESIHSMSKKYRQQHGDVLFKIDIN